MKFQKYFSLASSSILVAVPLAQANFAGQETENSWMNQFMQHVGSEGTQHNERGEQVEAQFYQTNADLNQYPFLSGWMGTAGTYRHFTVQEQTAMMIGEPKHGLWRIQDAGMVRMYLRPGKLGLPRSTDPATFTDVARLLDEYVTGEESYGLNVYRYPDQEFSGDEGSERRNWIDVSIHHPVFGGRYDDHEPIDLASYYCTMSQGGIQFVQNAWEYAKAQPRGINGDKPDNWGPLAKRAGMDIRENYPGAVRLDLFPDAKLWINTAINEQQREESGDYAYVINTDYQQVDLTTAGFNYEIYLTERPFFATKYLFLALIVDSDNDRSHQYIRPDGPYYEDLVRLGKDISNVGDMTGNAELPTFPILGADYTIAYNTPAYALAHADRTAWAHTPTFDASAVRGGACPSKGGDYAYYPFSNMAAAGWPHQYEEIGPICDALLLDIKLWGNLDGAGFNDQWNDVSLGMAHSAIEPEGTGIDITMENNNFGRYTDPYLCDGDCDINYAASRWAINLYEDPEDILPKGSDPQPTSLVRINFGFQGSQMTYEVPDKSRMSLPEDEPEEETPAPTGRTSMSLWRVEITQDGAPAQVDATAAAPAVAEEPRPNPEG